jgi:hypothetical protein
MLARSEGTSQTSYRNTPSLHRKRCWFYRSLPDQLPLVPLSHHCYKGNWHKILAAFEFLPGVDKVTLDAIFKHLIDILRILLHDEAYQLIQILLFQG